MLSTQPFNVGTEKTQKIMKVPGVLVPSSNLTTVQIRHHGKSDFLSKEISNENTLG